jgi:pentatricopeptide repeat protein
MWYILDKMSESRIEPSAATFALIIERTRRLSNLELTLQIYAEMQTRGFPPDLDTARGVIMMAASKGHPRLALDLAAQFEESSVRRLDAEVWMNCLASSAESLYVRSFSSCQ